MAKLAADGHGTGISLMYEFSMRTFARTANFDKASVFEPFYQFFYLFRQFL
ncbi:MAG: hypothetical protein BECKG1743E_GA0114224_111883 [Candidatus Kentron sp. G]|nr:MAG: hypothetical protein BECKG1743E_GA0114224_111883 [Candidatus Kentron sp. G]